MTPITAMIDVREGRRLFVATTGQGPPLMFGHSLTMDGEMWSAQVAALSDRFTCHCVDLHGHGGSADVVGPYTLDDMADDLARVLDGLGLAQVGYCGLSMGGMVGMRLALRHPTRVASVALMNTTAEPEESTAIARASSLLPLPPREVE